MGRFGWRLRRFWRQRRDAGFPLLRCAAETVIKALTGRLKREIEGD